MNLNNCKPGDICITESGKQMTYDCRQRNNSQYPHLMSTGETYMDNGRYAGVKSEFDLVKIIPKSPSDEEILRRASALQDLAALDSAELVEQRLTNIPLRNRIIKNPSQIILDKMNKEINDAIKAALDEHRKHLRAIADGNTQEDA